MNYDEQLEQIRAHGLKRDAEDGEQRSVTWLMERVGKVTASNFKLVLDFTAKGKSGAKRDGYLRDVVIERLTGKPTEHFVNAAMEHGIEFEPQARMNYEAATGRMVMETGFINHTTVPGAGGSPDGTIDDDGLIEIKCLTTRTHCDILLTKDVSDYLPQVLGLMWITGRKWCDFVSYDPRMPDGLQLYIQRIERDDDYIAELAGNVLTFLAEVDAMHKSLMAMATSKTAPPQAHSTSPSTGEPAAGADFSDPNEALFIKAREFAECGMAKYKSYWETTLTDMQRKIIGAERHAKFKKIAEAVK